MKKIITLIALTAFAAFSAALGPATVRADSSTGEQPVSTTPSASIAERTESTKSDPPIAAAPDDAK